MARLRLFAGLRDVAGTSSIEIDEPTVARVIESASTRFGPAFSAAAERARVWVNGDEAEDGQTVGPNDEVALIPPVSGGAGPMTELPTGSEAILGIVVGLVLVFVNTLEGSTWWSVAVVGVIVAWMTDVASVASQRARDIPLIPAMLAVVAAVVSTRMLGVEGVGVCPRRPERVAPSDEGPRRRGTPEDLAETLAVAVRDARDAEPLREPAQGQLGHDRRLLLDDRDQRPHRSLGRALLEDVRRAAHPLRALRGGVDGTSRPCCLSDGLCPVAA